jgi:hypothetical protein
MPCPLSGSVCIKPVAVIAAVTGGMGVERGVQRETTPNPLNSRFPCPADALQRTATGPVMVQHGGIVLEALEPQNGPKH